MRGRAIDSTRFAAPDDEEGQHHAGRTRSNSNTPNTAACRRNKRIALLIAILALFLSFSETLGKSAQTEAIGANVKSSDTWDFFQAKAIRKTTLRDRRRREASRPPAPPILPQGGDRQADRRLAKTAARYKSDPKTGTAQGAWRTAPRSGGGTRSRHGEVSPL